MHCDSVTACCDEGARLKSFTGQVSGEKLRKSGCAVQCFAIFTEGKNAAADFEKYTAFYFDEIARGGLVEAVCTADITSAMARGETAAVLTVENLGFLRGDAAAIPALAKQGVRMASLAWNNPNAFADSSLTPAGESAVEALNCGKVIVDISHLSDGAAERVLSISRAPVVASHSNCREICAVGRNLTDALIRRVAEGGGVVGLNFSKTFLGDGDAEENFVRHFRHLLSVGGEDVLALGSDFDGILAYPEIADCTAVRRIFGTLLRCGIPLRTVEKFALGNFLRVFREVVG